MKVILLLFAAGLCLFGATACHTPHGSSGVDGGLTVPELLHGGRYHREHRTTTTTTGVK